MRRLTVIAYEDISLANPDAAMHTVLAMQAAERLGFPEARIPIANVVVDLALSPKSNAAYMAMDEAISDLHKYGGLAIPASLQDGHYAGAKKLGRSVGYQYAHNFPGHWVNQQYLPDKLLDKDYFQPDDMGRYEKALHDRKKWIDEQKKKK